MQEDAEGARNPRVVGGLMVAAALLSVFAMAHHPTGSSNLGLARFVHGALMALMLCLFAGFASFAGRRGLKRSPVLLGLVAYGAGTIGNLIAATINGFAVPALIEAGATEEVLSLCWRLNQAFAWLAAFALSGAFTLWGADLALRGPSADRLLGIAGLAAGGVPAALLASGALNLHVSGAMIVYAAQLLFSALVGAWLMKPREPAPLRT